MAQLKLQPLCRAAMLAVCTWTLTSALEMTGLLGSTENEKASLRSAEKRPVCKDGTTRTGHCDLSCTCVSGAWQCCRLRKSVESMPKKELKRYIDVFLKAASHPRYKEVFAQIAYSHARFMCAADSKTMPTMVTWLRMQNTVMENLFRLIDCRVTIPFWDYALHFEKGWKEKIFSPSVFGGNGSPSDFCVKTGPFRKGKYKPPGMHDGQYHVPQMPCLQRNFSTTRVPLSWKVIQAMLTGGPETSLMVEQGLEWFADSHMHSSMRGSFGDAGQGVDPVFYSMHNFVDKLLTNWQLRGKDFLTGNGRWNNTLPLSAFPWFKANDWLDMQNLPGGVCVKWTSSQSPEAAMETGYYASMAVPRAKFLHLPYEELRHWKMNKVEATQYKDWLRYAKLGMGMNVTRTGYKLPGTGHVFIWKVLGFKYFSEVSKPATKNCDILMKKDPNLIRAPVSNGAQIL